MVVSVEPGVLGVPAASSQSVCDQCMKYLYNLMLLFLAMRRNTCIACVFQWSQECLAYLLRLVSQFAISV